MLSFARRRLYSTVAALEKQLLKGEIPLNKTLIQNAISNQQLEELKSILKKNRSLLNSEVKNDLIHHLPHDFSLYYLLKDHQWTTSQLIVLLANNPGRVDSSWDLFKRHAVEKSDELYVELITQLLGSATVDGSVDSNALDWSRILHLFQQLESKAVIEKKVLDNLAEFDCSLVPYFGFSDEVLLAKLGEDLKAEERIIIYQELLDKGAPLTHEQYANALGDCLKGDEEANKHFNHEFFEYYNELAESKVLPKENTMTFTERLVSHIEDEKLDLDSEPESLLIRMKMIDIYGMKLNSMELLLNKFHEYQSHAPFGIEMVQLEVVQSYCYRSFINQDPISLRLAEALMLEEIPTKTIQALILASSALDMNKALDVYNNYINHVSKKINPATGRSPCAVLTEAVLLASLYHNDKAFADLLLEKVVESKQLDPSEITTLKAPFKVFGEAWVSDSWDSAKPKLTKYIAERLKHL